METVSTGLSQKTQGSTYELVRTEIESRAFGPKPVPAEIKRSVLDAARLTGSGNNLQHLRFVLVHDKANLKRLASDSTTGGWVAGADFAVIVLIDPQYRFHMIDAGRAIQAMMLAAWGFGIGSGIFTGFKADAMAKDFALPSNLNLTAVVGFGYPQKKILGKKNRKPLTEVAYLEKYGQKLTL